MNFNQHKRRGALPHRSNEKAPSDVGESENAQLYEIREGQGKFPLKLFFRKKNGYKYKKAFVLMEFVKPFVNDYLRKCCLACKQQGLVYKVQLPKPYRGTIKSGPKQSPSAGTVATCPECKTEHQVQYQEITEEFIGQEYTFFRMILVRC